MLEILDRRSLIEVRLVTGKRNQIRIQAGLRGHALVGEERYVYHGPTRRGRSSFRARRCTRRGCRSSIRRRAAAGQFEAPLPHDLSRLVATLRRRARQRASPS